jgi:hypothetical protein
MSHTRAKRGKNKRQVYPTCDKVFGESTIDRGTLIAPTKSPEGAMSLPNALKYFVVAGLCGLLMGCESIALIPRPSVEPQIDQRQSSREMARETPVVPGREAVGRDRRLDRDGEFGRPPSSDEVVGTVQRVDTGRREIQLRTTDARVAVIKYDAATIVYDRDREKQVDSLRNGDLILVKITRNSQGEQFADLIRLSS